MSLADETVIKGSKTQQETSALPLTAFLAVTFCFSLPFLFACGIKGSDKLMIMYTVVIPSSQALFKDVTELRLIFNSERFSSNLQATEYIPPQRRSYEPLPCSSHPPALQSPEPALPGWPGSRG